MAADGFLKLTTPPTPPVDASQSDAAAFGKSMASIAKAIAEITAKNAVATALTEGIGPEVAAQARGAARVAVAEGMAEQVSHFEGVVEAFRGEFLQAMRQANSALEKFMTAAHVLDGRITSGDTALGDKIETMAAALTALASGLDAVPVAVDGKIAQAAKAAADAAVPPPGAYVVRFYAGDWGKRGWPSGTQVAHNGATWLAIRDTKPGEEPGPTANKAWLQTGLLFAGFVGAGSGRAARALAQVPPFFTTDVPPDPSPGNAKPFGGLSTQHVKGWVDTSTMRSYIAVQSDGGGGDWIWVDANRA